MSATIQTLFRNFFVVGPHAGAHRVALRAAASLAIPLLILYVIGRVDLAVYAFLGAFVGIYGRNDSYVDRVFLQATAGITILTAMLIGTLVSYRNAPDAFRVILIALVATAVTSIAFRVSWKPTGAMFAVFSSGSCATIAPQE